MFCKAPQLKGLLQSLNRESWVWSLKLSQKVGVVSKMKMVMDISIRFREEESRRKIVSINLYKRTNAGEISVTIYFMS